MKISITKNPFILGMNKFQDEMKQYVVDDDVKEINNKGIEAFQNAVGDLLFWNASLTLLTKQIETATLFISISHLSKG